MIRVTIIVVSYNTAHVLPACLDSIRNQTFEGKKKVVIVDTGNDGTRTLIEHTYPEVDYIPYPQNDGFGKANNIGIRKYYDETDYFLILNPDTKLDNDNIDEMVEYIEKSRRFAVLSCRLVLPDGRLDVHCKSGFPTPWDAMSKYLYLDLLFPKIKLFGKYNMAYLPDHLIHEVDWVKGAYMLARKTAIDEIGLFDEDYFMFGEDMDWCYRFKEKGWRVMYNPVTTCIHYQGVSSGLKKASQHITKASKEVRIKSRKSFYDSMAIFYKKHYRHKYPFIITTLVLFTVWVKKYYALYIERLKP